MKKINKTTTALSVAAAIVLSACGGDKTETPVENPVEAPVDLQ